MMRRLALLAGLIGFTILLSIPTPSYGQQGHLPVMLGASTRNTDKVDPSLPWISEYKPPAIYYLWIQQLASCEGLPFDLERIRKVQYFQVNAPLFIPDGVDAVVYAVTFAEAFDGQTYIGLTWVWNRALVSHEALHVLLKLAGDPRWYEHDPARFEKCGLHIYGPPEPNQ